MAETTIIPVELKKLVSWRVSQKDDNSTDGLVQKFMAAALTPRKVMPLDIVDLRKTQRRVATLLGQPQRLTATVNDRPRGRNIPTLCYVYRKGNSHGDTVRAESVEQRNGGVCSKSNSVERTKGRAAKCNSCVLSWYRVKSKL
ncbi:hypothetical protein ElyMa_004338300 [Elysia marginata]|uniref:Uncharacterized protein n=1 Tax=Elysia marginata TaxID=1093978 RepID=A0AAV4H106_9GAST|nr:hypothetical protein ElyMa_004338300 [Elysia marginata]